VKYNVQGAGPSDTAAVAAQLGVAFVEDPVMCWIWPNAAQRRNRMPRLFATQLRHHHVPANGVEFVSSTGGEVLASAVWDPPGQWEATTASTVRSVPALLGALRTRIRPALAVRQALDAAHPQTPHWYLNKIGTAPQVRGEGLGAALMMSRLHRCDAAGTDAYLECTRRETISYYERFGFAVTEEITVPGGGPTLWGMNRTPH
jgi:ribosomal protein S18 acetylase RimI-like enzyme